MINYITMFIGIIVVLISTIIIFIDKIKGEDIYFNIDFKEQEIKKIMEDADELISELNFTSETIVKQIEDKINLLNNNENMLNLKENKIRKDENSSIPSTTFKYKKHGRSFKIKNDKHNNQEENKVIQENFRKSADNKHNRIINYFKDGYSIEDIARTENVGKGEVELILSLRSEDKRDE